MLRFLGGWLERIKPATHPKLRCSLGSAQVHRPGACSVANGRGTSNAKAIHFADRSNDWNAILKRPELYHPAQSRAKDNGLHYLEPSVSNPFG